MPPLKPQGRASEKKVPLQEDPRADALQRILSSQTFANRARLRELLEFVGQAALDGRTANLKETLLATEVFGRPPDRHSGEDNIVRVTVRQLRAKLDEYYYTEGKTDPWIVMIPKGTYVPLFTQRESSPILEESASPAPALASAFRGNASSWWRIIAPWTMVVTLAFALIAVLASRIEENRPPEPTVLSLMRQQPGERILAVLSPPSTRDFRQATGRFPTLAEYRRLIVSDVQADTDAFPNSQDKVGFLQVRALTSLASYFGPDTLVVKHASRLDGNEFASEDLILFGGPYVNPWVQLFEPRLNFQIIETTPGEVVFRNRSPQEGESAEYNTRTEEGVRHGYCRVALVPNLSGSGQVLLLGGICGNTMGMLPSSVAQPVFLREVRARLGAAGAREIPYFEALLGTLETAGVSTKIKLVAVRPVWHDQGTPDGALQLSDAGHWLGMEGR